MRLRMETHDTALRSKHDSSYSGKSPFKTLMEAMLRPLTMLLSHPILAISFLTVVRYGFMCILYTTLPQTFLLICNWQPKNIGYAYLGIAVRNLLGIVAEGVSDAIIKRRAPKEMGEWRIG